MINIIPSETHLVSSLASPLPFEVVDDTPGVALNSVIYTKPKEESLSLSVTVHFSKFGQAKEKKNTLISKVDNKDILRYITVAHGRKKLTLNGNVPVVDSLIILKFWY